MNSVRLLNEMRVSVYFEARTTSNRVTARGGDLWPGLLVLEVDAWETAVLREPRPPAGSEGRDRSRQVGHFSKTHRGVSETLCRILHCLRSNFRFYKVFRTLLGEFSRNDRPVSTCLDPGRFRGLLRNGEAAVRGVVRLLGRVTTSSRSGVHHTSGSGI